MEDKGHHVIKVVFLITGLKNLKEKNVSQLLAEIPPTTACHAPPSFWNSTVKELADGNKWWSLYLLLVGGSSSANQTSPGVAHGCDASEVSIVAFLSQWETLKKPPGRPTMVKALLEVYLGFSLKVINLTC